MTAKRHGQQPLVFFETLFTSDTATVQAALYIRQPCTMAAVANDKEHRWNPLRFTNPLGRFNHNLLALIRTKLLLAEPLTWIEDIRWCQIGRYRINVTIRYGVH